MVVERGGMSLQERLDWCRLPDAEKYRLAVRPLKMSCDKGRYSKPHNRTRFTLIETDARDLEIGRYEVTNQRETAVVDGKAKRFYVWYCTCKQENCRHIAIAKRKYFAEWDRKKDAEAWLLKNDPTYVTAKMAAAGWIG